MADPEPEPKGGESKSVVPSGVKKKWGPLPIWMWVGTGAAVIGIAFYLRSKQSGTGTVVGSTAGAPVLAADPSQSLAANPAANDPMASGDLLSAIQSLIAVIGSQKPGQDYGVSNLLAGNRGPSGGLQPNPDNSSISTTHTTGGPDTARIAVAPTQVFAKITIPGKSNNRPSWLPGWVQGPIAPPPDTAAQTLKIPYTPIPQLIQNNPVSDYGKGQ